MMQDWLTGSYGIVGPTVYLTAALAVGAGLLNGLMKSHYRKEIRRQKEEGRNVYDRLCRKPCVGEELLIRRRDRMLMFLTDGFGDLTGLEPERVWADVEFPGTLVGERQARKFLELYSTWDGSEPMVHTFQRKGTEQWLRMTVMRCEKDYDLFRFENVGSPTVEFSKDESDVCRRQSFDLFRMAEQLQEQFQKRTEDKEICFLAEVLDVDVRYVLGDEVRIRQVLESLLMHVWETVDHGEIRLTFRQMHKEQDKVNLMMRIRGTGSSRTSPENIGKGHFSNPRPSDRWIQDGGGGLEIAQIDQLVRMMGGQMTIRSIPGHGSDFGVYIPLGLEM